MAPAADKEETGRLAARQNPDLIGHVSAERTFLAAVQRGRLHHAWLISGPRGIGKATLAFRMARYLFDIGGGAPAVSEPGRGDLHLDPASAVFRRVAAGGHSDLLTIERGVGQRGNLRSEIVVDDVRRVGEFLHLTPGEGGWRIVIVDSADELNRNAANALLKILEEPPARALVLLVSHNPGRLLPTIRSRCRTLSLQSLEEEDLRRVVSLLEPDRAPKEVAALAALARGSAGFALDLAQHDGLGLRSELDDLVSSLPRLDVPGLHTLSERLSIAAAEPRYRLFRELLMRWLADAIRAAAGASTSTAGPAFRAPLDRLLEVWDKIGRLFERADAVNLDRKQVLVSVFLTLQQATRSA